MSTPLPCIDGLEDLTTYKPKAVAAILEISEGAVYSIARRGLIGSVRFGSTVRFRRLDIEKFLTENAHEAGTPVLPAPRKRTAR